MRPLLSFGFTLCVLCRALAPSSDAQQNAPAACTDGDQAVAAEHWENARSLYENCLASSPNRFDVLSNLGVVYTRLGLMPQAIDSYKKALTLSPDDPRVEFNLAVALVKANQYGDAVEHLSRLRKTQPDDLRIEELLAFSYYHLGRYSLAARAAERVYKLHPDDAGNALILGSAYTRLGYYEKALPLVTQALKAAGSAEGHLIMAETLLGLRLYKPAMDELVQASALQPNLRGLHTAVGMADEGLGKTEEAKAEFALAIHADPNDYQANYYMGRRKRLEGELPAARKFLTKAEQLSPGTPEVGFEVAVIEMKQQHYAKAEALLKDAIRKAPDHRQAHFVLAEIYLKQGRREAAERERKISEMLEKQQSKDAGASAGRNLEGRAASSSHDEP